MSENLWVYGISKENAEKHDWIKAGLEGAGVDDIEIVCCGPSYGFSRIWMSPRAGWLMEGLQQNVPKAWSNPENAFHLVTKEQFLAIMKVSREVALRDREDMRETDFYDYLIQEYDEFEKILNEYDFENNVLFARTA